jgi:3-hydroxy-3-methylglutaryl CoA synthase
VTGAVETQKEIKTMKVYVAIVLNTDNQIDFCEVHTRRKAATRAMAHYIWLMHDSAESAVKILLIEKDVI